MAFDVLLSFHTPHAGRVTGYLTAEPIQEPRDAVTHALAVIQGSLSDLPLIRLVTRESTPVLGIEDAEYSPAEVIVPSAVIKRSVLVTQIVEVAA